jgi:hypothetical protein
MKNDPIPVFFRMNFPLFGAVKHIFSVSAKTPFLCISTQECTRRKKRLTMFGSETIP